MPSKLETNFPGPEGQLEGVLHLPDRTPSAIVVIAHPLPTMGGTMDNKVVTTLAKTFVELGFAVLRFNYRGVGNSAGSYDNGNGETLDTIAASRFMREKYPDLPLISAGFSFGGYVQARAAAELQPRQLVLIAPAVGRFAMPEVPDNTLLIHGDLDEVVDLHEIMQWARPQHLPVVVLAGAEHYFHGRLTQLKQIVQQHFRAQS